jgi:hypothetical protein
VDKAVKYHTKKFVQIQGYGDNHLQVLCKTYCYLCAGQSNKWQVPELDPSGSWIYICRQLPHLQSEQQSWLEQRGGRNPE